MDKPQLCPRSGPLRNCFNLSLIRMEIPKAQRLTVRQLEIARLHTLGALCQKAIGWKLGISHKTVDRHLSDTYRKLGVCCVAQLYTKLVQQGLITLDEIMAVKLNG